MYIDLTEEAFQKLDKVTDENKSRISKGSIVVFGMVSAVTLKMSQFTLFVVTNEVIDSVLKLTCIGSNVPDKVWEFDKTYVVLVEEMFYTPHPNPVLWELGSPNPGVEWRIYA
jgi:hypothetical protein